MFDNGLNAGMKPYLLSFEESTTEKMRAIFCKRQRRRPSFLYFRILPPPQ